MTLGPAEWHLMNTICTNWSRRQGIIEASQFVTSIGLRDHLLMPGYQHCVERSVADISIVIIALHDWHGPEAKAL